MCIRDSYICTPYRNIPVLNQILRKNQLEKLLRDGNASGKLSLCFVDLDDLKLLNLSLIHIWI